MRSTRHLTAAVLAAGLLLTACGGGQTDDDPQADDQDPAASADTEAESEADGDDEPTEATSEPVTISVSNLPPATEASVREAFLTRVAEFEAANPHITVEPSEYEWDVATFAAQLAGGTLPTVVEIPFTDVAGLIERDQVSDITAEVQALPYAEDLNPNVLQVVQDDAGAIYGLPIAAYAIGLHYNRALFEEAGLDPDDPPATWDEVREYADTIAEATGQAGYAQMSQSNTGGWMLTSLTYAHGGRLQEGTGEDVTSTIANDGTRAALELLRTMRWEDDAMGDNFLFDWGTINQAFAAGQIGMYMGGSDVYNSLVTENEIDPEHYGLTTLPLEGDEAGVLTGGGVAAVKGGISDAERAAAVAWIDHFYLSKMIDQEQSVSDAEALAANDAPVGTPTLPLFDAEQLALTESWIEDYINVPLEQMRTFKDGISDQPVVPEPSVHAQEIYAILDSVVQAVLTREDADIDALLADADQQVTALIGQG